MKRIIIRDVLFGIGLSALILAAGTNTREIFKGLDAGLLIIVLITIWLYKKTYGQAIKSLITIARILQVPVIISLVGLGIAFYVNRYNTDTSVYIMLVASLASVGLSYKLLLDWTIELKKNSRMNLEKHKKTLISVISLWLIAEGILLFVSL